jgi:hypothetical protein
VNGDHLERGGDRVVIATQASFWLRGK